MAAWLMSIWLALTTGAEPAPKGAALVLHQKDGRRQLPVGIYLPKRGRLRFWGYLRAEQTKPASIQPDGRPIPDDFDGYRFPVKRISPEAYEIVVDSRTGRSYWVKPDELKEDFRLTLIR